MTSSVKSWKTYRLGDLAQYINGKAFKPEEWKTTGLPIIRIQNLTDADKAFNYCDQEVDQRYLVNDGDLLISWSATLGSFIWNRGPSVLNQHIFKALPNENLVEKEFLHFLMLNTLDEMAEHAHGIAMKHITKGKFEAIEVSIPNLSEQRRIVASIKNCLERVTEIVQLRTEGLKEAVAVLPSVFHGVFEAQAKTSIVKTIGAIAIETRYGTSDKCHTVSQGIPVLRIPNVAKGEVNFSNLKYCDLSDSDLSRLSLVNGDLLFVRTNGSRELVGRSAVFTSPDDNQVFAYASYLIRVRLNQQQVLPQYLSYFLNSTKGREELDKRRRTSAGQFNINSENLRTIPLPVPSIAEQHSIIAQLQGREALATHLVESLTKTNIEAGLLSEAILRKAFAGEL